MAAPPYWFVLEVVSGFNWGIRFTVCSRVR